MELLASYGKRTARESGAMAVVVSRDVIGCNGKPIDLRSGQPLPKFVRGVAYSRAGHLLVITPAGAAIEHPGGRIVPLEVDGTGVLEPSFVGSALIMQDDPTRARGLGVFDLETGVLRGRLEHQRTIYGTRQVVEAFLLDAKDGRHVWASDNTRLRCWDVESVRSVRDITMPADTRCFGVGLLSDGNVVTNVRPSADAAPERGELLVFEGGKVIHRCPAASSGFLVVGTRIVLQPWLAKQLVVLSETLEPVETIPLPQTLGRLLPMINLWSDADEFIGAGTFNQVHHFGEPALRPAGVSLEEPGPATKPAKGADATKKPAKKKGR